ncbi:MAG: peptidoglycan synthase, partial [[Pasteurella] aerogenes]|nr:peptidoglycan synthase [[Pasteurella] aerogenes]
TPLQIARAYVTLGSFGIYRPLSITKVDPPVIGNRVFPEKITREVVNMLEKVAIKNKRAMVEGYRVGIKTGTAKKLENGRYVDKYVAYTVGIAPISDPRYALVVLINEPKAGSYYGGAISAPVFSNIMSYALRSNNITPDAVESDKTAKRTVRLSDKKEQKVN